MNDPSETSWKPTWSRAGFALGVKLVLPILPGMIAFALACGAVSVRKGQSFILDTLLMNGLVYAGASQMIAIEIWPDQLTLASVAALAAITAHHQRPHVADGCIVAAVAGAAAARGRSIPCCISQPIPAGWSPCVTAPKAASDAGVFLGGGVAIFVLWMVATSAGYLLGALISDPRAVGLDLVMPIFFAAMLIPLWQNAPRRYRRAFGWIVAAVVALAFEWLFHGWWFIIAGAVAGAIAEGFAEDTV